jgi:RNA polymerase sigma-70 factor (ECF subfamily)
MDVQKDPTPQERAALVLHDLLGWEAADVAELLDTDLDSLDGLLTRARVAYDGRSISEVRLGTTTSPRSGPRMKP